MTSATPRAPAAADAPAKMYPCPVCARVFNKKANLKVHSRKHTGEKPYACSVPGCERRFMWKSSVTFHEQNCVPNRKPTAGTVPKRRKVLPPDTNAYLQAPYATADHPAHFAPTQPRTAYGAQPRAPFGYSPTPPAGLGFPPGVHFGPPALGPNAGGGAALLRGLAGGRVGPYDAQGPAAAVAAVGYSAGAYSSGYHKPITPTTFSTEPTPLPAPSTILPSAGRPPVIPGSMPKFYPPAKVEARFEAPPKVEARFEVPKVEARFETPKMPAPAPLAKPLAMLSSGGGGGGGGFKMPISMELDNSDDEGGNERTPMGAQESFLRTGNIFGGVAPPTRCSPLPSSSPIVGTGLSPMPLSPLHPFSPLPPDSPAHNAPNPVHPPLNQPQRSPNFNM